MELSQTIAEHIIDLTESDADDTNADANEAEGDAYKTDTNKGDANETDTNETDTDEGDTDEGDTNESDTNKANTDEGNANEADSSISLFAVGTAYDSIDAFKLVADKFALTQGFSCIKLKGDNRKDGVRYTQVIACDRAGILKPKAKVPGHEKQRFQEVWLQVVCSPQSRRRRDIQDFASVAHPQPHPPFTEAHALRSCQS